ncbi:DNA polymerase I [Terriglobus sp. 2YAB30_2]|uniref:DNA polymerase I n=1 Tax=Terriglobus sp. 2YAB30_2 TaxID=3233023 RepID=UPI003F984B21
MADEQKPAIYLLDAMAFIFRAYHAMQRQRPMSTRTGIPTAATYVFVNMINKLRRDFQPKYLAAIYDPPGPVFRDERAREMKAVRKWNIKTQQFEEVDYAGYKATRTETPPDLLQQMPYIRRSLDAFRIPVLLHEGFEADDVIGTLSCKFAAQGYKVYVVSSDKDMMQLVNDDVLILNPTKDNLILDSKKVEETLGVPPQQVIDVMALRGDSVDNIPGAPGIGDKGSVELIQQFGTVEAALDRAEEVKRKTYRESLQNNRDNIMLSKELVTIHKDVPVEYDLAAMETQAIDPIACRELFTELEFTTLLKELAPPEDAKPATYILDPTPEQLTALLTSAKKGFALAVFENAAAIASEVSVPEEDEAEPPPPETGSLFAVPPPVAPAAPIPPSSQSLRLGLAVEGHDVTFVDMARQEAEPLKFLLEDENVPKSVHDLKSALRAIESCGFALRGVVDDVMLYSYLINPTHGSHTLADIAARFSSRALGKDPNTLLVESADAVLRLAKPMRDDVTQAETMKVYDEIDKPLVPLLLKMERAGVRIDREVLSDMSSRLAVEIDSLSERIYETSGHRFNINSPKQLGDVLFNKMALPKPLKYGKGKVISTAQDVLEELAEHHKVPRLVLEFRQLAKLKSTYLDQLPQLADNEGRIHTTFNQVGTATGRLSSVNPNLQNIPVRTALGREIRAAFIAAPGNVLLSADYSQIELRLMAHFSDDPLLVDAYRTGKDIHTLTASEVFGVDPETMDKETRNRAKAVNFGIVYGISPFGLAAQLGIEQKEAKLYIERYFDRYKGVRAFIDSVLATVREEQKVKTLFGRVRPIPDIQSRNANMRGFAERTAVNTPLQGTAADLIKVAMLHIDAELSRRQLKAKMTLQVHDELLFDVPPEEAKEVEAMVKHEMESVIELKVPLVADTGVGNNWRDIK